MEPTTREVIELAIGRLRQARDVAYRCAAQWPEGFMGQAKRLDTAIKALEEL